MEYHWVCDECGTHLPLEQETHDCWRVGLVIKREKGMVVEGPCPDKRPAIKRLRDWCEEEAHKAEGKLIRLKEDSAMPDFIVDRVDAEAAVLRHVLEKIDEFVSDSSKTRK